MKRNWMMRFVVAAMAFGLVSVPTYSQSEAGAIAQGESRASGRAAGRRGGAGRMARNLGVLRALTRPAIQERLGLSAVQKDGIDTLLFDSAKRAIQLEADLKSLRLDMVEQMKSENPDRAALEGKIDEIGTVQSNLARLRLDAFFQLREILTPEQRSLLRETLKNRRGARRGPDDGENR